MVITDPFSVMGSIRETPDPPRGAACLPGPVSQGCEPPLQASSPEPRAGRARPLVIGN